MTKCKWMILSWVIVQSESEGSLEPMDAGLANHYTAAGLDKAKYHWVDRYGYYIAHNS